MSITILEERPLGAQTVRGTVLFVDLRGYTTLAEGLSPDTVAALLEEFFSTLTPSVDRNGGTVFHLAGDSLMAGFGLADDSVAPVRAAIGRSACSKGGTRSGSPPSLRRSPRAPAIGWPPASHRASGRRSR